MKENTKKSTDVGLLMRTRSQEELPEADLAKDIDVKNIPNPPAVTRKRKKETALGLFQLHQSEGDPAEIPTKDPFLENLTEGQDTGTTGLQSAKIVIRVAVEPAKKRKSVLTVGTVDLVQMVKTENENKERRKSRWSSNKAFVPGLPTILPSDLDDDKTQVYLLTIEVEEITRKLRLNIFASSTGERSPSPEPIYDNTGKRLNTREVRKKQELEQKRHEKITQLKALNPDYKPPADYRPPNIRIHEKIWIPQDDHPEINFVGLLIGPRGNTLRSLEQETGAKIIIRGKGSIKEGKIRREGPMPGENEPLHAYVTGADMTVIQTACEKIRYIIEEALSKPDANSLRQNQLRELAILNGTLRAEDILGAIRCTNCGSDQHKTYECQEQLNFTASITCSACGAGGHIARDCLVPRIGYQAVNNEEFESEYSALMSEIAEVREDKGQKIQQKASTPFKLPPPQFSFQYNRPPVQQYINANQQYINTDRFYVNDLMFQFPSVWPDGQLHQELNDGNPLSFWPPPPPPPPSMPEE
ncbi:hypothetical protein FO519_005930 [Halicephalobus sp. NKZ332]|nr:hypothetical protein FO519_005930 [Halicephalobus sp. NKZ332]